MATFALILLILLPQVWTIWAAKNAAWRIGMLTLSFLGCIGLLLVEPTRFLLQSGTIDRTYHDTYYVVAHFRYVAVLSIALGVLTLLLFIADPRAKPLPRISRWLASLLAVATAMAFALPMIAMRNLPRRYVEYEAWAQWHHWLNKLLSTTLLVLWCALAALALIGLVKRLAARSNSG